jgi:crotonobetainyl-CoA:carnitine CoA-transferase CaiB-like acyl-CoA transferase
VTQPAADPGPPPIFGGVRVVDFTTHIAGPYTTMFFSDHGADVIKVEPPGGDPYRSDPGFQTFNRGKRSVVIDLMSDSGRSRMQHLVRSADVVVVDMTPDQATSLQLDYESLRQLQPDLIHLSIPPYGSRGPLVRRPASPALLSAVDGTMAGQSSFSGDPVQLTIPLAAYGTAPMAAAALSGALLVRERDGTGQALEVSQLAGSLALQAGSVRSDLVPVPPRGPSPTGSRGLLPVYRLFQAGDDLWFFIACGTAEFFHKLLIAIDRTDLSADPRVEHAPWGLGEPGPRELLEPMLEQLFRTEPREHWLRLFAEHDVPAQPVQTREEYFASRTVAANEMWAEVDHETLGTIDMMGVPIVLEASPGAVTDPAPELGDHTDIVLAEAASRRPVAHLKGGAAPGDSMLAGVRVLDLSGFIAGAVCPRHLAMLGADVLKIEPPTGDPFRQMGLAFLGWNQGKRGLSLNLRTDEARELFYRLVAEADVVVENYRPGVTDRLGISYETLRTVNPRLVYVSISGWGEDESMAEAAAFDPLIQAVSGAMAAQGGDDEPVFYSVPLNDVMTPALATFGTLAALYHRERTGEGQRVRASLARTGLAIQAAEFTRIPRRRPSGHGGGRDYPGPSAGERWYRCGDDTAIYVEAASPAERQALVRAAGVALDPAQLTAPHGSAACTQATDALAGAFQTRDRDSWIALLDEVSVPCNAVIPRSDVLHAAHVRDNNLAVDIDHPTWGRVTDLGMLIRASATPGRITQRAPLHSEHAHDVLGELGVSGEAADALLARGIVARPEEPQA